MPAAKKAGAGTSSSKGGSSSSSTVLTTSTHAGGNAAAAAAGSHAARYPAVHASFHEGGTASGELDRCMSSEKRLEAERHSLSLHAFELITVQRHLLDQALSYNALLHDYVAQRKKPSPARVRATTEPNCMGQGFAAPLLLPVHEEPTRDFFSHRMQDSPDVSLSRESCGFLDSLKGRACDVLQPSELAFSPMLDFAAAQQESARKAVEQFYDAQTIADDVENKYKDNIWSNIAMAPWFKNITLGVIFMSIIWIAIDTDYNKAVLMLDAPPLFIIVDNAICIFFLFELTVRFLAFRKTADALSNSSFLFDGFLVMMTAWELWGQTLLFLLIEGRSTAKGPSASTVFRCFRLARIMRVLRMSRIFRSVPELFILVKGMVMALRSVTVTLMLLLVVTYTFAIFLTDTLAGTDLGEHRFVNVPGSMNFLLLQVVCGFDSDFITSLYDAGNWGSYFAMLSFLLIGSLTIMNMLVGVLVDVVATASDNELEEQASGQLRLQLRRLVALTDQNGDNVVTRPEFLAMFSNPDVVQHLDDCGVNVLQLLDHYDFMFRDVEEMSLEQFVKFVLQFREQSSVNAQDLMDLRLFVSQELTRLQFKLRDWMEGPVAGGSDNGGNSGGVCSYHAI